MQREVEGVAALLEGNIWDSDPWNLRAFQLGTDCTCRAKPRQIARKSIGEVHHSGRQTFLGQPLAQREPRLRIKMPFCEWVFLTQCSFASLQDAQTQFCLPQPPTGIKDVAPTSSRSQHGVTGAHFAHDGHIDENFVLARRVSTCQRTSKFAGSAPPTPKE